MVAFFVLPIFVFANAGISLADVSLDVMLNDVPVGGALGVFLGKPIGIFGLCAAAIYFGFVRLPKGMSYLSILGVSALRGIGFTMSLFVGFLVFEETGVNNCLMSD